MIRQELLCLIFKIETMDEYEREWRLIKLMIYIKFNYNDIMLDKETLFLNIVI